MKNHREYQDLARVVQNQLGTKISMSGRILLSPLSSLREGPLYLVGLNPGRKANNPKSEEATIDQSLTHLRGMKCHPYLCESWNAGQLPGSDALQLRARWFCSQLGLDIETVCASNLVFMRSDGEGSSKWRDYAERCWGVHLHILQRVQPTAIILFQRNAYNFFSQHLIERGKEKILYDKVPQSAMIKGTIGEINLRVILFKVGHFSRYSPDKYLMARLKALIKPPSLGKYHRCKHLKKII
ncbi:MAG: hypothetical protein JWO20_888 [Candidatus Angelobacter sp.]|nr:hypothetical protein [Candidatus Angelobacter sp.]